MLTFQLPVIPDAREIDAVVGILEEIVGDKHPKGIQIFRDQIDGPHASTSEEIERLVREHIPKGYVVTLHAPISPKKIIPACRLDCEESMAMVNENIDLAVRIGARSVIVHTGTSFYHPLAAGVPESEEKYRFQSMSPSALEAARGNVYHRVARIGHAADDGVLVSIENDPLPIGAESVNDLTTAFLNPYLSTFSHLADFNDYLYANVPPTVGICFDTAHYIRTIETIRGEGRNPQSDTKAFFDIVRPSLDHVSLMPVVEMLLSTGRLYDIQIADSIGWSRGGQKPRSFSIAGGPHEAELVRVAKIANAYCTTTSREIVLSLDVDEHDYIARPNQRASLQFLVDSLR